MTAQAVDALTRCTACGRQAFEHPLRPRLGECCFRREDGSLVNANAMQNPTLDQAEAERRTAVREATGVLLVQLQLDREQSHYWRDRNGDLDAAEAWLQSIQDWATP